MEEPCLSTPCNHCIPLGTIWPLLLALLSRIPGCDVPTCRACVVENCTHRVATHPAVRPPRTSERTRDRQAPWRLRTDHGDCCTTRRRTHGQRLFRTKRAAAEGCTPCFGPCTRHSLTVSVSACPRVPPSHRVNGLHRPAWPRSWARWTEPRAHERRGLAQAFVRADPDMFAQAHAGTISVEDFRTWYLQAMRHSYRRHQVRWLLVLRRSVSSCSDLSPGHGALPSLSPGRYSGQTWRATRRGDSCHAGRTAPGHGIPPAHVRTPATLTFRLGGLSPTSLVPVFPPRQRSRRHTLFRWREPLVPPSVRVSGLP